MFFKNKSWMFLMPVFNCNFRPGRDPHNCLCWKLWIDTLHFGQWVWNVLQNIPMNTYRSPVLFTSFELFKYFESVVSPVKRDRKLDPTLWQCIYIAIVVETHSVNVPKLRQPDLFEKEIYETYLIFTICWKKSIKKPLFEQCVKWKAKSGHLHLFAGLIIGYWYST